MENVEHICPQNECNDAIAHFIRICLGFNEDVLLAAERKLWPVWPLFSALPWSFVLFFLVSFFYSVLLSWLVSRCLFVIIFFFFLPMRLYLDIRSSRAWCLCAPYVMQAWRMWEQMEVPPFFFFFSSWVFATLRLFLFCSSFFFYSMSFRKPSREEGLQAFTTIYIYINKQYTFYRSEWGKWPRRRASLVSLLNWWCITWVRDPPAGLPTFFSSLFFFFWGGGFWDAHTEWPLKTSEWLFFYSRRKAKGERWLRLDTSKLKRKKK